nr:type VII secretion-associated serine protease mycosin [Catellatospora sp. IY07-71]
MSDGQWFHNFLRTDQAHEITTGSGVTVAVIDSGVDGTHPDLQGSVLPGVDLSSEGPGDGHRDASGHGTSMAGLIAAHGKVRGIAPDAKILPVRAFTTEGFGGVTRESILWAVEHGADVISISAGGDSADPGVRRAIDEALKRDVVVVAAAGNRPADQQVIYPAAFPGVVAVGAVNKDGVQSSLSVTGPAVVVAAPGDDITSTGLKHRWSNGSGTSGATAIVAGAAALIRAQFPDLSAVEVVRRLTSTAVDKGYTGRDPQYGFGVLDLVAALTTDVPPPASATPGGPTEPGSSSSRPLELAIGVLALTFLMVLGAVKLRRRG